MKFFFENSGLSEIVVRNPHDRDRKLPDPIGDLFRGESGSWSLLPITRLLPQVTSICLTDINHEDIEKNGNTYIQCIAELQNVQHFQQADNSRIEFRTKMARDARKLDTIKTWIDEPQKAMKKKGWTLEYDECGGLSYHRIVSRRMNLVLRNKSIPLEEESKPEWIWKNESADIAMTDSECVKAFELSLDAEPEILDQFTSSDVAKRDEKLELHFCTEAVMSVIGEDVVKKLAKRPIIDGIKDDGILIVYRLIANDVRMMTAALKQIESRKAGLGTVQYRSCEFPVISNVMIDDISLSEMLMRDELEQKKKEEDDAQRDAELNRMKEAIEKERLQMKEERERQKIVRESESQIVWEQKQKNEEKETILRKREERLARQRESIDASTRELQHQRELMDTKIAELAMEQRTTEKMKINLKMERLNMETLRTSLENEKKEMDKLRRELSEKSKMIAKKEADLKQKEERLRHTGTGIFGPSGKTSSDRMIKTLASLSDPNLHSVITMDIIDDDEKIPSPRKPSHRSGPVQIRKNGENIWSDKKLVLRDGVLMVHENTLKDSLSRPENGYLGKVRECKLTAITSGNEVMFSMKIESNKETLELKSTREEYKKWSTAIMGDAASPSGPYLTRGPSLAASEYIDIRRSGAVQICDTETGKWKKKWMVLQDGELILFSDKKQATKLLKRNKDKGKRLSKLSGYIGMTTDCMLEELAVFKVINERESSKENALEFKCTTNEYNDWCNVLQVAEDTEYPTPSGYNYY